MCVTELVVCNNYAPQSLGALFVHSLLASLVVHSLIRPICEFSLVLKFFYRISSIGKMRRQINPVILVIPGSLVFGVMLVIFFNPRFLSQVPLPPVQPYQKSFLNLINRRHWKD